VVVGGANGPCVHSSALPRCPVVGADSFSVSASARWRSMINSLTSPQRTASAIVSARSTLGRGAVVGNWLDVIDLATSAIGLRCANLLDAGRTRRAQLQYSAPSCVFRTGPHDFLQARDRNLRAVVLCHRRLENGSLPSRMLARRSNAVVSVNAISNWFGQPPFPTAPACPPCSGALILPASRRLANASQVKPHRDSRPWPAHGIDRPNQ
jgi:hypothetical protein